MKLSLRHTQSIESLIQALTLLAIIVFWYVSGAPSYSQTTTVTLPVFVTGGDVSELLREEQLGAVYKDKGVPGDALRMFKMRGCKLMRLRLWVNPTDKGEMINDLPYTIALGRRLKSDGFMLLLDLHYSDTWADPGHQSTPAAWQKLSFPELVTQVYNYSRDVISAMRQAGAMPDIVEVGNEINSGILWPTGRDELPGGWANLNALLKAGIAGVRKASIGTTRPQIMLHLANGATDGLSEWFYDNLQAPSNGGPIDFDLMGFSYYPTGSNNLDDLKFSLLHTIGRYQKPIIIVETAYPSGDSRPGPAQTVYAQYGISPAGQKKFLTDLIAMVKSLPSSYGRGVIYWAPEWLNEPGLPQFYGLNPLFDSDFNAKPALDALTPN